MKKYQIKIADRDVVVAEYDTSAEALEALDTIFYATDKTGLGVFALALTPRLTDPTTTKRADGSP